MLNNRIVSYLLILSIFTVAFYFILYKESKVEAAVFDDAAAILKLGILQMNIVDTLPMKIKWFKTGGGQFSSFQDVQYAIESIESIADDAVDYIKVSSVDEVADAAEMDRRVGYMRKIKDLMKDAKNELVKGLRGTRTPGIDSDLIVPEKFYDFGVKKSAGFITRKAGTIEKIKAMANYSRLMRVSLLSKITNQCLALGGRFYKAGKVVGKAFLPVGIAVELYIGFTKSPVEFMYLAVEGAAHTCNRTVTNNFWQAYGAYGAADIVLAGSLLIDNFGEALEQELKNLKFTCQGAYAQLVVENENFRDIAQTIYNGTDHPAIKVERPEEYISDDAWSILGW